MPKKKPFEELLQECMPNWKEDNGPLRNLARQYLGGHAKHLTDDAVSNTLIEALEVFSEFDQQKPFLPNPADQDCSCQSGLWLSGP